MPTDSRPFIMVAGTGKRSLEEEQRSLAERVGRGLAKAGFGLITCGWPGVDAEVSKAFVAEVSPHERPRLLRQYVYRKYTLGTAVRGIVDGSLLSQVASSLCAPGYIPHAVRRPLGFLGGQLITVGSESEEFDSVQQARALVLIGGMNGTLRVAELAERLDIPVLPLATSQGASRSYYEELLTGARPRKLTAAQLQGLCGDEESVTDHLVQLLHDLLDSYPEARAEEDPLRLYISHAAADAPHCRDLLTHLSPLQRAGKIVSACREAVPAGAELASAVHAQLERAQIIIQLISANYYACDLCWREERPRVLQRSRDGQARVLPVLVSPVENLAVLDGLEPLTYQGMSLVEQPCPARYWSGVASKVSEFWSRSRPRTQALASA